jgi:hypothetical protein
VHVARGRARVGDALLAAGDALGVEGVPSVRLEGVDADAPSEVLLFDPA